ncbi:hypothetical protein DPMN_137353 [Dreissena polymorpha]|uniref:Uncharacterized protein n=1 Tax=Dreissena polymorpha TaxID=45954 RepID=A0A9D4G536_DREPO|nr:hypothetical protein DPMN_137353 [Dreissena polymorpha]
MKKDVLKRVAVPNMTILLRQRRLRWTTAGYPKTSCTESLLRQENNRSPHLRYKAAGKSNLKAIDINPGTWEALTKERCN